MLALTLALLAQSPCAARAIVPSSFTPTNEFGRLLEVSGNRLMATGNSANPLVVFERDPTTGDWLETQSIPVTGLPASALGELAMAGDHAIVRASTGQSFQLEWDPSTGTWSLGQPLAGLASGLDVEIVGDVALISSMPSGGADQVLIFEHTAGAWMQTAILDPGAQDFGASISFDGRAAVIGAPSSLGGAGEVFVYQREVSGGWTLRQRIHSPNSNVRGFGSDVELAGDVLAVGAPRNIPSFGSGLRMNSGRVEIFRYIPSTASWLFLQTLRDLAAPTGARLGDTIKLRDGYLVATSMANPSSPVPTLYSYRLNIVSNFFRLERLFFSGGVPPFGGANLGRSVGITGPLLLAGITAPNEIGVTPIGSIDCDGDQVADSCEILLEQEFDTNRNGLPDPCEETGVRYCSPAAPNSTGAPARMAFFGPPRVALLSVDLYAQDLPPGSLGYFIASQSNQVTVNPGMWLGSLCVDGSPISRQVGGARIAGGAGRVEVRYNRSQLPNPAGGALLPLLPGTTWYFQYWYRDCGTVPAANFSDAVQVDFTLF